MRALMPCTWLSLLFVAGLTSCGGSDACVPGQQTSCACTDGRTGAQACDADGASFGVCVCTDGSGGASSSSASAAGGGGGTVCTPNESIACWSGSPETRDVGACRSGIQQCSSDGAGFGPCTGEILPAAEDCSTAADDACTGELAPCGADSVWSRRNGDASDQDFGGVAVDDAGDVLVAETFVGTIDFGTGPIAAGTVNDLVIAKLDPSGNAMWTVHPEGVFATALVAADGSGDVIFAGSASGTVDFGAGPLQGGGDTPAPVVARLSADGSLVWARRWSKSNQYAVVIALAVTPHHDIFVAGPMASTIDLGCGSASPPSPYQQGVFVARLTASGDCIWTTTFGHVDDVRGLAPTEDGGVYVSGPFADKADFGAGMVGQTGAQVYLVELDPAGNHVLSRTFPFGVNKQLSMGRMVRDGAGTLFMTGTMGPSGSEPGPAVVDFGPGPMTANEQTAFVVAFDASGKGLWSHSFTSGYTTGGNLALDSVGQVLVAGTMSGSCDFGSGVVATPGGAFVARWDAAGAPLGAVAYDGPDTVRLAVDGNDHVVLGGRFTQPQATFPGGSVANAGGTDVYVADVGN